MKQYYFRISIKKELFSGRQIFFQFKRNKWLIGATIKDQDKQ